MNLLHRKSLYKALLVPLLILLIIWVKFYFQNDYLLLNGEGNYFVDFDVHQFFYGEMWFPESYGKPDLIGNSNGININFLRTVDELFSNKRLVNFSLISLIFVLPYIFFYALCRRHGLNQNLSILISLFYLLNPFSSSYLQSANQWAVFSMSLMPLIFLILDISKTYFHHFIFVGLITSIFSFTLYNPPTALPVLSTIFLGLIIKYSDMKINIQRFWFALFFSCLGFLVFNLGWINNIFDNIGAARSIFNEEFSLDWISTVVQDNFIILNIFSLTQVIAKGTIFDTFYNNFLYIFIGSLFTLFTFILSLRTQNRTNRFLSFLLILLIFLSKGTSPPFASIYDYLVINVPYFFIFKTPTEKFGIILVFILSYSIIRLLRDDIGDLTKIYKKFLLVLVIFYSLPFLIFDGFSPTSRDDNYEYGRYFDYKNNETLIQYLKENHFGERAIVLPGGENYQVLLESVDGKFYSGINPILSNSGIDVVRTDHDRSPYELIFQEKWEDYLEEKDITLILFSKKEKFWFGAATSIELYDLERVLKKRGFFETHENEYYTVFSKKKVNNRIKLTK